MNEKEAIDYLNVIQDHMGKMCSCHSDPENFAGHLWHTQEVAIMDEIIEWLQIRADIIERGNNPPERWDPLELPFVYNLAMFQQKEAHIHVDMYIMWHGNESNLDKAVQFAKLAYENLKTSVPSRPNDSDPG